jgi:hypothetical protein
LRVAAYKPLFCIDLTDWLTPFGVERIDPVTPEINNKIPSFGPKPARKQGVCATIISLRSSVKIISETLHDTERGTIIHLTMSATEDSRAK